MFQSTHLQEVRRGEKNMDSIPNGFNPRTYKRCDLTPESVLAVQKQFQSTHLQEVRHVTPIIQGSQQAVSIHAPTRGATR